MSDYPFFIPEVVLCANSSLFWFKVANEHREFRNYLNIYKIRYFITKILDITNTFYFYIHYSSFIAPISVINHPLIL